MARPGEAVSLDEDPPPDTGCDVAPACLECPLPECIYVDGGKAARAARGATVVDLLAAHSITWVVEHTGIPRRTVARIKEGTRKAPA